MQKRVLASFDCHPIAEQEGLVTTGDAIGVDDPALFEGWSRVAGDVMDLVLLGRTLRSSGRGNPRTVAATAAVAGLAAVDLVAARRAGRSVASPTGVCA